MLKQYYFEQEHAIEIEDEDVAGKSSRDKANWMMKSVKQIVGLVKFRI